MVNFNDFEENSSTGYTNFSNGFSRFLELFAKMAGRIFLTWYELHKVDL